MSRLRVARRIPVIATILIAFLLTIVPLPRIIEAYRPDWIALVLIYWAMVLPRNYSVGTAWIVGIVLDVAQGTLLGQHALALCVVVYLTVRFHLLLRVFPPLQLTLTVFALLIVYQFLLFWVNGVVDVIAPAAAYWGPVISGTLLFPLLSAFLTGVRYEAESSSN